MNSQRAVSGLSHFIQGVCGWWRKERHGAELGGARLHLWRALLRHCQSGSPGDEGWEVCAALWAHIEAGSDPEANLHLRPSTSQYILRYEIQKEAKTWELGLRGLTTVW